MRRTTGGEPESGGHPGLTRLNWDLRPTKDVLIEYGGDDPRKLVPSGEYTAELSYGKEKVKQKFRVDIAEGIETRDALHVKWIGCANCCQGPDFFLQPQAHDNRGAGTQS